MRTRTASDDERERCPLEAALRVIDGKWTPMICRRLGESGALGFGQLRRAMPGVTAKVLRQQLRQMEAAGVVTRCVRPVPLRVRYSLTRHGRTLGPVFETLWSWGTRHLARRAASNVKHSAVVDG